MFENIKKLSEIRRQARAATETEYDENGRELIRMSVKEDDGFLSPYALKGESVISGEVNEFLDNAVKGMPLKEDLRIEISGDTIDDAEREEYTRAVKNFYRSRVIEIDRKLKRNGLASFIMMLAAIIILAVYVALELSHAGYVLLELIDITAWVFMWEAVDLFFLERKVLKTEQLRDCRLYGAYITFAPRSGQPTDGAKPE